MEPGRPAFSQGSQPNLNTSYRCEKDFTTMSRQRQEGHVTYVDAPFFQRAKTGQQGRTIVCTLVTNPIKENQPYPKCAFVLFFITNPKSNKKQIIIIIIILF